MDSTSFILTYRHSGDPARRANLATVLSWLEGLGLAEVILVEQDAAPGLDDLERFDRLRVGGARQQQGDAHDRRSASTRCARRA